MLELLLGLSLALCKEKPLDDSPGSLTIVFFSGILGFSDTLQSFLLARFYASYLCVMIYNQRLFFLESTIPVRSYPTLGIKKRPRTGQVELLGRVRKRFMVMGSQSSFDELFGLRNYGRVIAKSDIPPFLLHWSDDGHEVRWNSVTQRIDSTMCISGLRSVLAALGSKVCREMTSGIGKL